MCTPQETHTLNTLNRQTVGPRSILRLPLSPRQTGLRLWDFNWFHIEFIVLFLFCFVFFFKLMHSNYIQIQITLSHSIFPNECQMKMFLCLFERVTGPGRQRGLRVRAQAAARSKVKANHFIDSLYSRKKKKKWQLSVTITFVASWRRKILEMRFSRPPLKKSLSLSDNK